MLIINKLNRGYYFFNLSNANVSFILFQELNLMTELGYIKCKGRLNIPNLLSHNYTCDLHAFEKYRIIK